MSPFGSLAPDDPALLAATEGMPAVDPTPENRAAMAAKLGQTWPARMVKDAAHAIQTLVEGDYHPGLRRADVTDIPAPTGPTADSTRVGAAFGLAPAAYEPNDKYIQASADTAGLLIGGPVVGPAEAGAVLGSRAIRRSPVSPLPMDEASRMARAKDLGFDTTPVYHGTADQFNSFDPNMVGTSGHDYGHKAYWFTENPKVASDYAGVATREVRDAGLDARAASQKVEDYLDELRLRNGHFGQIKAGEGRHLTRLENDAEFWRNEIDYRLEEQRHAGVTEGANVIPAHLRMKKPLEIDAQGRRFDRVMAGAVEDAKAGGHDGLIVRNVVDPASERSDFPATVRAVFKPEQIRSTFAAFDPANKNKHFLLGSGQTQQTGLGAAFGSLSPDKER